MSGHAAGDTEAATAGARLCAMGTGPGSLRLVGLLALSHQTVLVALGLLKGWGQGLCARPKPEGGHGSTSQARAGMCFFSLIFTLENGAFTTVFSRALRWCSVCVRVMKAAPGE